MGAGKTTLISALVRTLGGTEEASSPTFSIVNEYEVENDYVYHFDFYRIKNHYEALDIGVEDYFCSGYWNFIEWPQKTRRHQSVLGIISAYYRGNIFYDIF